MIHGQLSSLSRRDDKVFADRLMDRDTVDRASLRVKERTRFKEENECVKSSFVGLVYCVELVELREKRNENRV